jgi:hypothetical protein
MSTTKARDKRPQRKEPRITVTKGIRLTENELAHVGKLLPQYPECASEAELLRQATLIGLYVLAAQATGQPAHGGYQPDELVSLLKYRVLPAIDFLFERGALPALYRARKVAAEGSSAHEDAGEDATNTQIIPDASAFLGELGTEFMDD